MTTIIAHLIEGIAGKVIVHLLTALAAYLATRHVLQPSNVDGFIAANSDLAMAGLSALMAWILAFVQHASHRDALANQSITSPIPTRISPTGEGDDQR